MSEFDQEKWFNEVLGDAGLAPEELEAVKKALGNEKVAPKLKKTVLATSDYSKGMDELRKQKEAVEAQKKQIEKEYYEMLAADHNNKKLWEKMNKDKKRDADWRHNRVDDEGEDAGSKLPDNLVTKEQMDELFGKTQEQFLQFMDESLNLYDKHVRTYGEGFNLKEVVNYAVENRVPIQHAYESMTAELRDTKAKEAQAKLLEDAKKEAVQEYISNNNIPGSFSDRNSSGYHPFRNSNPEGFTIGKTRGESVGAAVAAFRRGDPVDPTT